MVQQKITVRNAEGLHMRPAAVFAQEMAGYDCDITLKYKKTIVNAKSLLSILSACIVCGSEITIECNGKDEIDAMKRAITLIDTRFVGAL